MTSARDPEASLSAYFEAYVEAGKPGGLKYAAQHPVATATALRTLRAMPSTPFAVSDGVEASTVERAVLDRPGWGVLRSAVSALRIPVDPAEYTEGSSKQTVRRKVRAAERAGVTWRRIDDADERRDLLRYADEFERTHARETYRNADADNRHLVDVRLWIAAFGATGEPLMLSVTPLDGEWAALSYFRTFSTDPAASDARYLLTKVLVQHLSPLGVRRVVDTVSPAHLQNGLRHFQRMVGFRIERIEFARTVLPAPSGSARDTSSAPLENLLAPGAGLPSGTAAPPDAVL